MDRRDSNSKIKTSKSNDNNETSVNAKENMPTLDDLFKKTKTKPHIYFLPLSDQEVQQKRLKMNINK
jgi:hypothetical protein